MAKKKQAKPKYDAPVGFIGIDKKPSVQSVSPVASESKVLLLALSDGKTVKGRYQSWDRDINAPHLTAKKGTGFFHTQDGVLLKNVVGYKES